MLNGSVSQQPRSSPLLFVYFSAGIITLLGLSVLYGWHSNSISLIQVNPAFAPMQYNTALAMFLSGCSLLASIKKQRLIAIIGGLLVTTIGALTLVEYITLVDLGIDQLLMQHYVTTLSYHPGRMAPNTALCFFISGSILFLTNLASRFQLLFLLGAVIIGLGLIAFLGYLSGLEAAYGWAHFTRMAIHTSAGFVLLGSGLLVWGNTNSHDEHRIRNYWPVIPFAVLLAAITLTLWQSLIGWETRRIQSELQTQANNFASNFNTFISSQINALDRMSARWDLDHQSLKELWHADAEKYVEQLHVFQGISWVDKSFHLRWMVPLEGNEEAINLDLSFEQERLASMQTSRDERRIIVTRSLTLVQGGLGFLIDIPLFVDNRFDGFLTGVIRIDQLFTVLSQSSHFNTALQYRVFDGDKLIYTNIEPNNPNARYQKTTTLSLGNVSWRLELIPTNDYLYAVKSPLPNLIFIITGLLSVLLLFYFYTLRHQEQLKSQLLVMEKNKLSDSEQEKQHLSERNTILFNSAPVGMMMVDEQGKIITTNTETLRLFGYQADQLIGQSVDILVPSKYRMQHDQHRQDYMLNPSARKMAVGTELQGQRLDGGLFTLDISLTPLQSDNKGPVLVSMIDITELTENRRNLTNHAAKLEKINLELERSNKELNDFAYIASHDLKAPLRGIMQLANWIEEDLSDTLEGDTAEHLRLMQNRVSRLEGLLDDLLAFSRVGRKHGDFKTVNIAAMANEIFELLSPPAGFTLTCDDILPDIVTLSVPLEQLLRNLINNAIKHHDKDEGNIHISAQPADDGFKFVVSDDGPGIPPDHHERIFRIFQTLKPRDQVEGSGMGLAIIKKLLENYHCQITVESDGIRGTRMVFTWPKESTLRELLND